MKHAKPTREQFVRYFYRMKHLLCWLNFRLKQLPNFIEISLQALLSDFYQYGKMCLISFVLTNSPFRSVLIWLTCRSDLRLFVLYCFVLNCFVLFWFGLLADQINDGLRGLVLLPLCVYVDEVDLDVRQETGAVVDPLNRVAQSSRYGSALSANESEKFLSFKSKLNSWHFSL